MRGFWEPQDCLHSDWELESPLRVQVGSSIRKAVQAMGPAARGCQAVFSIISSEEDRPEEGVVTMEASLISYSAALSVPTMCWFPASCKMLASVDSISIQKGVSPCSLKSLSQSCFPLSKMTPCFTPLLSPSCCPLPSVEPLQSWARHSQCRIPCRDPPKARQLRDGC